MQYSVSMDSVATPSLYSLEGKQDRIVNTNWDGNMGVGSFLSSLASTAFASVHTEDSKCLAYLNNILNKFGNYGNIFILIEGVVVYVPTSMIFMVSFINIKVTIINK